MPCVLKHCSVAMIQWIYLFIFETDDSDKCDLGFVFLVLWLISFSVFMTTCFLIGVVSDCLSTLPLKLVMLN